MPPDSDGWQTLHPLTPILRSGRYALPAAIGILQTSNGTSGRIYVLPVVGVVLLLGGVVGYLSWRFTRYRLANDALELESGVFQRRRRRVPLARLESVDLTRNLVARAFGLAELHLEAVSTGESEVVLSYLGEDQAIALKATLLARRAGVAPDSAPPPEVVLATVPTRPLVISALLTPALLLVLFIAASVLSAFFSLAFAGVLIFGGVPGLLAITAAGIARQESLFGFTVAEAPDGLRIRRGLVNLRTQTIPLNRVQGVRIVEPLLWRPFGWARVLVDVAGYRGGGRNGRDQTSLLLPVAPRLLIGPILSRVLPGLDLSAIPLQVAPPLARWRAPLSYRRLGAAWTPLFAVTRRGRLRRLTDVVPHTRVQSLRITQGPLQRRLALATLHLDSPGSAVSAKALHRDAREAADLAQQSRQLDLSTGSRTALTPVQVP
ncbi:MAG TPA: PH domain-containing protein [Mycobacteriales bacterium]|nr:PH domain-containing protein [Mycobacteriales bacterium]